MTSTAIVGAGFCGVMLATHLLRQADDETDAVFLVERGGRAVGGIAYGTSRSSHALNVPAGRMSAYGDEPDDFLRFVRRRDAAVTGGSFVPRGWYGDYLAETLAQARRSSPGLLTRVAGDVVAASVGETSVRLELRDGRLVDATRAVLAVGNFPPSDPAGIVEELARSLRYARDPWAPDALEVEPDQPVLLLGTGLTACDMVLALRERDHRGPVIALSRRGLLPQPHRLSSTPPPHLDPPATLASWPHTAVGMLRGLRAEVETAAERGLDWREVVTSLREATPTLWQRLDIEERRRFLRYLLPFWETHRHRSSPETAFAIESLRATGELRVIAGALLGTSLDGDAVAVTYMPRGQDAIERLVVGKIVNCTGPDTDLRRVRDPLIESLRADGEIRPDELGLGVDADASGRLIRRDGRAHTRLFVVGPLRKGALWENTAVPELRLEVESLARLLVAESR